MPGSQGEGNASNKRQYGKDTLRPVTIKQLLDAHHPHPDAEHFMIDDSETTQVTFVAQVRNISTQTTNVTYKLDDGTGTIEVKVWVDAEAAEMDAGAGGKSKVVEQGYARVWGRLKHFNNKRHLGAQFIRPITDLNEISYHLLEATVVHLHYTKGPLESLQTNSGAQQSNGAGHGQQNGMSNGGGGEMAGMSPSARKVYGTLRNSAQTNEGLHAQVIASEAGLELSEVMKAGDELMALGKVYTTVDDLTWALLDL